MLTANRRNKFTGDICSSIRDYTMNPTKVEREHVRLMVIKKYPFLADSLGKGIVSNLLGLHIRPFRVLQLVVLNT